MKRALWLAALLVAGGARAEAPLDQDAMRAHIAWLADDAREGRAPGTPGGDATAHYVADALYKAGLRPGPEGWYQPVKLVERVPGKASGVWRRDGEIIALGVEDSLYAARDASVRLPQTPVVFAGYGVDPAAIDVNGKVVLILSARPQGAPTLGERREALVNAGAVAVIALTGEKDPWELIHSQLSRGRLVDAGQPTASVEGAIAYEAWQALVPPELVESGKPALLPLTFAIDAQARVRHIAPVNVIGRIDGSDPRGEAVMFLAHWDHLGLCRPEGAPDRICNGAVDNASGIAMMIEVAKRLAAGKRPRRSIYFVATTAEESGLLGARWLVRHPPVPLGKIAAVLNLDTVAIAGAGAPVAVIGRGRTPLDPVIDKVVVAEKRTLDASDAANAFITRQDGWAFLQAGVPAVMVGGAFSDPVRLATFLAGDYHGPADDMKRQFPLDGAAEDGALHVALARFLADPDKFPLKR